MNVITIATSAVVSAIGAGLVAYAVTVNVTVPVHSEPQINQAAMTAAILDANRQMQAEEQRLEATQLAKRNQAHCRMYPDEC